MGRKNIQRGPGKQPIEGKNFRPTDEILSIQSRAAGHAGRWVRAGPPALYSIETGGSGLLDTAIAGKDKYRITGEAFTGIGNLSGRVLTILGGPAGRITQWS